MKFKKTLHEIMFMLPIVGSPYIGVLALRAAGVPESFCDQYPYTVGSVGVAAALLILTGATIVTHLKSRSFK
ncbi:hypothetical protein [Acidithiobacillus thiooxidans]|uniref:hypothetical protein n=1 Tax=Acidithiobacillus thiooxidans TaxID=930 RepID=UPI0009D9D03A|nr:hypothetical protein [Acidithiobacillus thiooxidans]